MHKNTAKNHTTTALNHSNITAGMHEVFPGIWTPYDTTPQQSDLEFCAFMAGVSTLTGSGDSVKTSGNNSEVSTEAQE